jgi:hypothetical protein
MPSQVGRQYLMVGAQGSAWFGSGSISTLSQGDIPAQSLGNFSDRAWGAGPLFVGLAHVVAPSVIFELRLGAGAHIFENDRLVSKRLESKGELHVGHMIEAEIIGRYFNGSGPTFALGANLGNVGLTEASSTLMRISPRAGWMVWDKYFDSFWMVEAGYQFPIINGLIPDIEGTQQTQPIESMWHVVTLAVTWGF